LRSVINFKPTKIMDGLSKMFYKKKIKNEDSYTQRSSF